MIKSNNSSWKFEASNGIRYEIGRFESVHPNIYAIYELIDELEQLNVSSAIRDQIREYVVSIEDSFVNSQEWTLPRFVNVLKLALIGSNDSGKSSLVHRYLTGVYMDDESPEGGRFKKELVLDNQENSLLLIRDEAGSPEVQLSLWTDAVFCVFNLTNAESLNEALNYLQKVFECLRQRCIAPSTLPVILIGTQDDVCDETPRQIDDYQVKELLLQINRQNSTTISYYETCATYGLNIDRVFQDICMRIISQQRSSSKNHPSSHAHLSRTLSRPQTPMTNKFASTTTTNSPQVLPSSLEPIPPPLPARPDNLQPLQLKSNSARHNTICQETEPAPVSSHLSLSRGGQHHGLLQTNHPIPSRTSSQVDSLAPSALSCSVAADNANYTMTSSTAPPPSHVYSEYNHLMGGSSIHQHTHHHSARANSDKESYHQGSNANMSTNSDRGGSVLRCHSNTMQHTTTTAIAATAANNNLIAPPIGSGRLIPIKQGYLYKKSSNQINKDRRNKKYVTLTSDGKLAYYPNMNDYMNQTKAKEIDLSRTTIKLPGVLYRNSCLPVVNSSAVHPNIATNDATMSSAPHQSDQPANIVPYSNEMNIALSPHPASSSSANQNDGSSGKGGPSSKPTNKHRHRRQKSTTINDNNNGMISGVGGGSEEGIYEFFLVDLDGRQWSFEGGSAADRDDWVSKMESVRLTRFMSGGNSSGGGVGAPTTAGGGAGGVGDGDDCRRPSVVIAVSAVPGNDVCADCGAVSADWASVNLGIVLCIECCGVHRQLGSHLSRVRSLSLDQWTQEHLQVMLAVGNFLANSVWEAAASSGGQQIEKPVANSSRRTKEEWIRRKYVLRQMLPPLPHKEAPLQQQLVDAICRGDTRQLILCLARAGPHSASLLSSPYSPRDSRTALHIAATLGHIVYLHLLLWAGADPLALDSQGRSPYYYAHCSNQGPAADFLHKCTTASQPHNNNNASQLEHNNIQLEHNNNYIQFHNGASF